MLDSLPLSEHFGQYHLRSAPKRGDLEKLLMIMRGRCVFRGF